MADALRGRVARLEGRRATCTMGGRDSGLDNRTMSVILLFDVLCFPLFDGPIGEFRKSAPDATQHAVVLAAVKDAARR